MRACLLRTTWLLRRAKALELRLTIQLLLALLYLPVFSTGLEIRSILHSLHLWRRTERSVPEAGYYNPYEKGSKLLTKSLGTTYPDGQGEPVNAIISGNSDAQVLVDQEVNGGLKNYFLSLDFSTECLGQHQGTSQQIDLGDGNGLHNETAVIRYNYGDPALGACTETILGGNHFRYWVQNGPDGNSGAVFLACSYEMPISKQHDIVRNGYSLGRDYIIGNITGTTIPTLSLTNESTFSGNTSWAGYTYHTSVIYVSGMLSNTSIGINHNETVKIDGVTNAIDGLIAVLDIQIVERPESDENKAALFAPLWGTWSILLVLSVFLRM